MGKGTDVKGEGTEWEERRGGNWFLCIINEKKCYLNKHKNN